MTESFFQLEDMQLAQQKVARFVERYEPAYRLLLYHAALPLVLTPELLNYLRTKFLQGKVPWVAEADLLLSDLCQQVGYEQYVMDSAVRAYLLQEMKRDATLGEARMEAVARMLIHYVRHLAKTDAYLDAHELQAQQWAAMVFIEAQREMAVQEITTAFKNAASTVLEGTTNIQSIVNQAEMARLAKLTQELASGLEQYPELVDYAANVTQFLVKPTDKNIEEIRKLFQKDFDAALHLPPAENVDVSLSYTIDEKDASPNPNRIRKTWLEMLKFRFDPFLYISGERDPNLVEYFYPVSSFINIVRALSVPATHLVFGEEGSGKSSLRNAVAQQCRINGVLPIIYSDFQVLLDMAKQGRIIQFDDHIEQMHKVALVALETEIEGGTLSGESTLTAGRKKDLYASLLLAYVKQYSRNVLVRQTLIDAFRLNTDEVQALPQDPHERLSLFFECVRGMLGYENICFLIDPVNDTAKETEGIWLVLQPLLSDSFVQKLSQDKAALVFFLNSRFRDLALTIDWINYRQATCISMLEWSERSLHELLEWRLKYCSGAKPYESLSRLSDNIENLNDMVIQKAGNNPRNLIALCSAIFDTHCQKPITEDNLFITREEVAKAFSQWELTRTNDISQEDKLSENLRLSRPTQVERASIADEDVKQQFVGRSEALELFYLRFAYRHMKNGIYYFGKGGLGKTWLLRKIALDNADLSGRVALDIIDFFDSKNHSVRGLQATIKQRLGESRIFESYDAALTKLDEARAKEDTHLNVIASLESRANRRFIECCQKAVTGRDVIFLFDTFERVQGQYVGQWLVHDFLTEVRNALFVIAGRPDPKPADMPDNIEVYGLKGLELADVEDYISRRQPEISKGDIENIWKYTSGEPLTIQLILDLPQPQRDEFLKKLGNLKEDMLVQDSSELRAALVEQFTFPSLINRVIWAMAYFRRRFDTHMLRYIVEKSKWFKPGEYDDIFRELQKSNYVKEHPEFESHMLQGEMLRIVSIDVLHQVDPDEALLGPLYELIVNQYYPHLIEQAEARQKPQLISERFGYLLDKDHEKGLQTYTRYRADIDMSHDYAFEELLWGELYDSLGAFGNNRAYDICIERGEWLIKHNLFRSAESHYRSMLYRFEEQSERTQEQLDFVIIRQGESNEAHA